MNSLAWRMSLGLALQSLAVLAVVSLGVYGWGYVSTRDQQDALLAQQRTLLDHLFREARTGNDETLLRHKIDDALVAQELLTVEVVRDDGSVFYRRVRPSPARSARVVRSELPAPNSNRPDWTLRIVLSTDTDQAALRLLAASLIAATAVGTLLISLGGSVLVRRGLRPIDALVQQIQALSAHTLARRVDGSAQPAELRDLVDQFNALLIRLQQAYRQLESFNADVAHELATPLTTLIGGTELALRRPRSTDELRNVMISNLEELNRLSGIVRDMLFLAHADHGASVRSETLVALAPLAHKVVERHQAEAARRCLSMEVRGEASAGVDAGLIDRALSNLLSNALRYATPESKVQVTISSDERDAFVAVENDGIPVRADRLERFFERFYRGDAARSNAVAHHGLGLSIVDAISRMHGGMPFAHSAAGRTVVGVSLPLGLQTPIVSSHLSKVQTEPAGIRTTPEGSTT